MSNPYKQPQENGPIRNPVEPTNVLRYLLTYKRELLPGFFFAVLRSLIIAPCPWLFRVIIDEHLRAANIVGILSVSLLFVGLLALHYVFAIYGARAIARVMVQMNIDMRSLIFHKLQFLSFGYLDRQKTGQLISKYAFDTQRVEQTLMQFTNSFFPNVLYGLTIFTLLVLMNWQLSLIILFMLPIFAFARLYFFGKFRKQHWEARMARERLTGTASELISALRLVRSFGEEKQASTQLDESSHDLARTRFHLVNVSQMFNTFTHVSSQALSLVVIAGGALLVLQGSLTIGTLFAFLAGMPIILAPIQLFGQFNEQYFLGQESYNSVRELLDSKYVEDWKGTRRLRHLQGDIKFNHVSFTYTTPEEMVIRDFNLHIKPGEHVAFVGPSGSGKSTLANLVLGLYKPTDGRILIDDCPQEELNMRWFRRKAAVVMQESILLSGSVMENLRFAQPGATDEEVREAARQANAEEFILKMPEGYDSPLGERGVTVSGGQRQRISIARAILRNPQILILDEATSALDYHSERLIQEALERLSKGRTVITIAHRLSTIRSSDRIVVLSLGRKVEEGSFNELSNRDGYFSELLKSQSPDAVEPNVH